MPAPVTVVIITHQRRDEVLGTVARLRALPEHPPVVVVDNGSTDGTADALRRRFPEVRLVALPDNRGAAGRNVGVRAAATEVVAFADDDSWWRPGALAEAAGCFERHPRLGLLAARLLVEPGGRDDPINAELAAAPLGRSADLPGPDVLGFLGCAAVVRRRAFLQAGGFEPRLGLGAEERLLALDLAAAGWGLAYVASVVAHHQPSTSRDSGRRRVQVTRNDLWTSWLRRPGPVAARHTAAALRRAARDPEARTALSQAVRRGGWVARDRTVLPPPVEHALRRLEAGAPDQG